MINLENNRNMRRLPGWVPQAARVYLAHTESGKPIRELAREAGCHASTVLRQVRRIETRRDDPLVDAALRGLTAGTLADTKKDAQAMSSMTPLPAPVDEATLTREARRVLRRLCESGAVLAVAAEMDKAVVVRDTGEGGSARTAVVESTMAQAMALKDWIACDNPGRISRYRITAAGRAALSQLMAEQENRLRGFAEAQAGFDTGRDAEAALEVIDRDPRARKGRYMLAESPLTALSRRRDKDGEPFLNDVLVAAGERLREDFELAQLGHESVQDWEQFLSGGVRGVTPMKPAKGAQAARARLEAALRDLGPGLGDVALRCCCYLEGLETTEKRLGWSARSGKIVLRIALQRLRQHYDEAGRTGSDLIG
jgi:DNA-binding MarR family transcriptional regulator